MSKYKKLYNEVICQINNGSISGTESDILLTTPLKWLNPLWSFLCVLVTFLNIPVRFLPISFDVKCWIAPTIPYYIKFYVGNNYKTSVDSIVSIIIPKSKLSI